jgi:short-subunit dehydrogenase
MIGLRLKRVLITGAAHGFGKAMAKRFADRGAEVVLTDLHEEHLEATRQELADAGAACRAYVLDVTDGAAVLSVRERLHEEAGRVDVLVNNAGVVFGGAFLDVPLERHRLTYRVNVDGVLAMTHAFLGDVIASPSGGLVFVASASGFVGLPYGSSYASSKWSVIGLAESLRAELKHQGHRHVGVTTVCPTYLATGMFEGATPPKTTKVMDPDEIAEKVVQAVEHRRVWVREPFLAKLTPFLKHGLPTSVSDYLGDFFGATSSMKHWRGHDESSG